jgi:tetratricopeptide (TPR) repeat protein
VDFLDPWPDRIFLKRGLNNAGVAAQVVAGVQDTKLVRVTREEFERVILGLASADSIGVIDDFFEMFPDAEDNSTVNLAFGMQLLEAADHNQPALFGEAVDYLETAYRISQKISDLADSSFHIAAILYLALVRGSFDAVSHLMAQGDNKPLLSWETEHRELQNKLLARYGEKKLLGELDANQAMKLGIAAQKIRQYKTAIECFTRAIQLDPNAIQAMVGRGEAYLATKDHKKSLQDSTQALDLLDKRITQYQNREHTKNVGEILENLGEPQALASLRKRLLWLHAHTLLAMGETKESQKFGKLLIELDPDWYGGYVIAAESFKAEKNYTQAKHYIDQALEQEKDSKNRTALLKMKGDIP